MTDRRSRWLGVTFAALLAINFWNTYRRSQGHWFSQDDFAELEHARSYLLNPFPYFAGRYPYQSVKGTRELIRWPVFLELSRHFGFQYPAFLTFSYLVHGATGVLAMLLARRLGLSRAGAAIAGVMFLWCRPAFTSIYWMSILTQPVSRALILLNLLLFTEVRWRRSAWYWAVLGLTQILALAAHEQSVVLFPLQLLLGWWLFPDELRRLANLLYALFSLTTVLALLGFKFWVVHSSPQDSTFKGLSALFENLLFHGGGLIRDNLWLLPAIFFLWFGDRGGLKQTGWRAALWIGVCLAPYILLEDQSEYYRVLAMFGPALLAGACVDQFLASEQRALRLAAGVMLLAWQLTVIADPIDETGDYPRGYRARQTVSQLYGVLGEPYGNLPAFLTSPFSAKSLPPRPLYVIDPQAGTEFKTYTAWLDLERGSALTAYFGQTFEPIIHVRAEGERPVPANALTVQLAEDGGIQVAQVRATQGDRRPSENSLAR